MDLTQLRKQESNKGEFMAMDQFVPSEWNFDYLYNLDNLLDQEDDYIGHTFSSSSSSSLMDLISQPPQSLMSSPPPPPPLPPISFAFDYPFLDTFQDVIETSHSPTTLMLQASQGNNNNNNSTFQRESNSFMSIGDITNKKNTFLKVEGKPSKNLMAERRRRKRLNDRLSMLRSIVPKITKMDRTSILGDAIEYTKELLEKINKLQKLGNNSHLNNNNNLITNVSSLVRNSPTFEVEQSKANTDIDINCCMKPGLIMSTISTLENLGLEIQQCVISSFNDFSLQASCLKVAEQRDFVVTSEDIKQALLINAGYGGSCS